MSFSLNRKSRKQLKRFANALLDNPGYIARDGNNSFAVWGDDPVLRVPTSVTVEVNSRGKVDTLTYFCVGQSPTDYDNQFVQLKVKKPRKAINWFKEQAEGLGPDDIMVADMTNPQPFADAFNDYLPGLAGGSYDVYVSFGDYYAFA